ITDQAFYFQSALETRAFDNIYRHFDELSDRFIQPDAWSILANLIYWMLLLLLAFAKAVSMAVIAFGLTASAVCALLDPLLVPSLTTSIFSGQGGQAAFPGLGRFMRR